MGTSFGGLICIAIEPPLAKFLLLEVCAKIEEVTLENLRKILIDLCG